MILSSSVKNNNSIKAAEGGLIFCQTK